MVLPHRVANRAPWTRPGKLGRSPFLSQSRIQGIFQGFFQPVAQRWTATGYPRWQAFEADFTHWLVQTWPAEIDRWLQGLGKYGLILMIGALLWLYIPLLTSRLAIWQQGLLALLLISLGHWIIRLEEQRTSHRTSEYLHLLLISLSTLTTLRYLYYRTSYTLNFDSWLNGIFCTLLYVAELYAIGTLFLSYFQTLKLKHRQPVDLATIPPEAWPNGELLKVDIYIPTYNEDVEIVRKTVIGALAIDYPKDKKQVYILDDGRAEKYRDRRRELEFMAEELGCTLLVRDNNDHAKAGNINTALPRTQGDLVLILDCDHIPARGFLQHTVGFFLNPQVALVQTPHWFYNPDPFERNLLTGGLIPVGNELFYKVLQKGNDYWNATFFCGSAAVVRRKYVLEIGGIATETVTEDCHTALRLHSLGYETIYYDKIMVAGLAPEMFSSYVGQQVRWARGMAQILRLENPLFNRKLKLSLPQRICYFSATSHFFFGYPRLMYVLAPMLYLLLGISSVKGLGLETLVYALPHILLSMQTNHIPYKHVRFSFWNEIYEFAMSFQAGIVTLLALINPKLGSFNVTDKGLTVTERNFDFESVRYLLLLAVLAAASLLMLPFWLVLSPVDTQAALINGLWCVFNFVLLLAACLVAFEQPQLRTFHRLPRQLNAILHGPATGGPAGQTWFGQTLNISESGCLIELELWPNIADEVRLELLGDHGERVLLDAKVVRATVTDALHTQLALNFLEPSRTQMDDLVVLIYSDVKEWYSQQRPERDNPWASLKFITTSLQRALQELQPAVGVKVRQQVQAPAQIYWDGWAGQAYQGTVVELGAQDLRLELVDIPFQLELELLQQEKPLLGVLIQMPLALASAALPTEATSLLAQVKAVEILPRHQLAPNLSSLQSPARSLTDRIVLELSFPEEFQRQQRKKIKTLLNILSQNANDTSQTLPDSSVQDRPPTSKPSNLHDNLSSSSHKE
jgi:cellulose synthase (UDP-forming)